MAGLEKIVRKLLARAERTLDRIAAPGEEGGAARAEAGEIRVELEAAQRALFDADQLAGAGAFVGLAEQVAELARVAAALEDAGQPGAAELHARLRQVRLPDPATGEMLLDGGTYNGEPLDWRSSPAARAAHENATLVRDLVKRLRAAAGGF